MATSRDGSLQAAMALLLQNQAALVSQRLGDREMIASIVRRLDAIEQTLLRHERILMALPEAIRRKVGFRPKS